MSEIKKKKKRKETRGKTVALGGKSFVHQVQPSHWIPLQFITRRHSMMDSFKKLFNSFVWGEKKTCHVKVTRKNLKSEYTNLQISIKALNENKIRESRAWKGGGMTNATMRTYRGKFIKKRWWRRGTAVFDNVAPKDFRMCSSSSRKLLPDNCEQIKNKSR